MNIPVAAIRRLTLHDGPGTRTTVFVKGCPLHCRWCHNPECISAPPQLLFHDNLCAGCGKCATVCTEGCHSVSPRTIDRSRCRLCGQCAEACWNGALEICGRDYTPEALLPLLMRDAAFYESGGGVTVSGGEPLLYAEAVARLFALLRGHGVRLVPSASGESAWKAAKCFVFGSAADAELTGDFDLSAISGARIKHLDNGNLELSVPGAFVVIVR